MSKCISLVGVSLLLVAAPVAEADPGRVDWLRQNAVKIHAIDPGNPRYGDFSDLEPLKAAIGDARIVLLGEATHEDGATFRAKARLVKFLHREMGFDVLTFEGDAIGYRGLYEALGDPDIPVAQAASRAAWSTISDLDPLFEYVRTHKSAERPLFLDGFDYMLNTRWAEAQFMERLRKAVEGLDLTDAERDFVANARSWSHYRDRQVPADSDEAVSVIEGLMRRLDENRKALSAVHGKEPYELVRRLLAGFRHNYTYGKTREDGTRWNIRDRGMASNVEWLARDVYPGRKLIVWAASAHTARDLPSALPSFPNAFSLGQGVHEAFGEEAYSIAFISHEGSSGADLGTRVVNERKIPPAPEGSVEGLLAAAGFDYAFLDLRSRPEGHWLRGPISARPFGHGSSTQTWSRNFDAFFFIREGTPYRARRD
jgi:erythromycin esterase